MTVQIKIIGEKNEATIVRNDEGQTSYECSRGAWCNRQDDIRWEDSADDALKHASAHVQQHDDEAVEALNMQNRVAP